MNVRAFALSPWLVLSFFVVACTGAEKDGEETTAAETTEETDTDTTEATWDECTEITVAVPEIAQVVGTGDVPLADGGEIVDGTYVLTAYEVFGASGLTSDLQGAIRSFSKPGTQFLNGNVAQSGTWTTSGTTLSLSIDCACNRVQGTCSDELQSGSLEYTATATTFTIFGAYVNGGTSVATYTAQ